MPRSQICVADEMGAFVPVFVWDLHFDEWTSHSVVLYL